MNIKELFDKAENGTLTWEQFEAAVKTADAKFVDIKEGEYVSKSKHENELGARDKSIDQLNATIAQRDTDLENLKTQLANAGTDAEKLSKLQTDFNDLQSKYTADTEAYKQQLAEQKYDFATRETANGKEFTSQAAKRDYIRALKDAKLKMKDDAFEGLADFDANYAKENADAFVVKQTNPTPPPAEDNTPQFVGSTPGTNPNKPKSLTEMMRAANENPNSNVFI